MEQYEKYDILIIGAGIAGISSAINLKKLDDKLKILVIDKNKFPRNKLCAGYLTKKSVNHLKVLGLNVYDIEYNLVKGLSIFYKNKRRIHANNHGLYCQKLVDRTVLDYELFKKLNEYDIDVMENVKIEFLDEKENILGVVFYISGNIDSIKYNRLVARNNIIYINLYNFYSSNYNSKYSTC